MGIYAPNIIDFGRRIRPLRAFNWDHGVLLRSTNWLGDLVMTLPASYQLKQLLPVEVPLRVLCKKGLAPIWQAAPWIDGVVPMAGNHISAEEASFVRGEHYGVGVVFPNSFGSAWDIWRCGIPQRIGRRGRFRWPLLTDTIPAWPRGENEGRCHQLSYYLELVRLFGEVQFNADCPSLRVDDAYAASQNISRESGWIALAPGAAYGPAKQWPVENFIAVAEACMRRLGRKIVVVGAAKEAPLGAQIAAAVPGVLDLTGKTSLPQLMSVLANCALVGANDSGTMHLAAALGTRGVGLFASTDPIATGPLGAPWDLEIAEVECRPCLKRECPFAEGDTRRYACMAQLPAERVLRVIEQMQ
jgi:heptosyltransferase II